MTEDNGGPHQKSLDHNYLPTYEDKSGEKMWVGISQFLRSGHTYLPNREEIYRMADIGR